MITVVDPSAVSMGSYGNMSLAEACGQLMLDTEKIVNEFNMDILINEHVYLYENGVEIDYVNEADDDEDNAEGETLRAKALNMVKSIGKKIAELWNKVIEWVKDRISKIIMVFKKAGISEKKFGKAVSAFPRVYGNGKEMALPHVTNLDFLSEFEGLFKHGSAFDKDRNDIYDTYVKKTDNGKLIVNKARVEKSYSILFGNRNYINEIKKAKKEANDNIESIKREIQATSARDIASQIDKLNNAIKANSKISNESIKVIHAMTEEAIIIAKNIIKDKKLVGVDLNYAEPGREYETREKKEKLSDGTTVTRNVFTAKTKNQRKKESIGHLIDNYENKYGKLDEKDRKRAASFIEKDVKVDRLR